MKHIFRKVLCLSIVAILLTACTNDEMTPIYTEQSAGKVVIRAYNAHPDSIQIKAGGKFLTIDNKDSFSGKIQKDYEFVYYEKQAKSIDIIDKVTGEVLHSYSFTSTSPVDTLSFYRKEGIWIGDVLSNRPGTLSATGFTGYRFIFPTQNRYSKSGYDGPIDAIIKKINGQVLGVAENITKEDFSSFVEFAYGPPPILNVQLVKHGTTEPYITGQTVTLQMVMQNNKSRLIILDEKANENGDFTGIEGTINLVDFFEF